MPIQLLRYGIHRIGQTFRKRKLPFHMCWMLVVLRRSKLQHYMLPFMLRYLQVRREFKVRVLVWRNGLHKMDITVEGRVRRLRNLLDELDARTTELIEFYENLGWCRNIFEFYPQEILERTIKDLYRCRKETPEMREMLEGIS